MNLESRQQERKDQENQRPSIDIARLRELRTDAVKTREERGRANQEDFFVQERARIEEAITSLPNKLEKCAKDGCSNCEVMVVYVGENTSIDQLRDHPAYGELIKYLEAQGLGNIHLGLYGFKKGAVSLYVKLP